MNSGEINSKLIIPVEEGGYVLLHDTWMRSTQLDISFIKKNRKDYRYQKVSEDARDGMHYKEFFTLKATFSHGLIRWMTTGKNSVLKKMMFFLKEKLK
jgi:hypothetical protein